MGRVRRDAADLDGYVYTTDPSLSSRIASLRHSDAIHAALDFRGKRVIDVGCGDGTYSVELFDRGVPQAFTRLIPPRGPSNARRKAGSRAISFEVASAYDIPRDNNSFDIAHLRAFCTTWIARSTRSASALRRFDDHIARAKRLQHGSQADRENLAVSPRAR